MDVVEVHHVRLEIVEKPGKCRLNTSTAEYAPCCCQFAANSSGERHLRSIILIEIGCYIVRIVHCKDRCLMSPLAQQSLKRHCTHAIAAARIIELIYNQYSHNYF